MWKRAKIVIFSLLPALVLFGLIEGGARLYWWHLESRALAKVDAQGRDRLANDAINFMKISDPILGYKLKPNLNSSHTVTTEQGFYQRESAVKERKPNSLRIIALGDSATQGHNVDTGSYPTYLRHLLKALTKGYSGGTEVINTGVPGWVSDQSALWAETELADYKPDIAILYVGFNDFQSYPPCDPPPTASYFDTYYGDSAKFAYAGWLKSVVLARAFVDKLQSSSQSVHGDAKLSNGFWSFSRWQAQAGATLGDAPPESRAPDKLTLPPQSFAWAGAQPADQVVPAQYVASLRLKGEGEINLLVTGLSKPWPRYNDCTIELSNDYRPVDCPFLKPDDGMGVELSLRSTSSATATVEIAEFSAHPPGVLPIQDSGLCVGRYPAELTYKFLLRNLDRIVRSFRVKNPNVKFLISTLIGRWPMDTMEQYAAPEGHTFWMEKYKFSREDAATALDRFNDVLRGYAKERGLPLFDAARRFELLDRQKLLWSFGHMTDEGYELLASMMFDDLVRAGAIRGVPPDDLAATIKRYTLVPMPSQQPSPR